jgi:CheY-specific phosphatase CheX
MGNEIAASFEEAVKDIFRENSIPIDSVTPSCQNTERLQVVSTMGITGDLRGNIIFGLTYASARAIIESLFLANDFLPQEKGFGDMQRATIGEFANQITGRALMSLARKSFDCNMTPPTVFTGDWVVPDLGAPPDDEYVSLVQGSFGSAVFRVGIKNKKKAEKNS